MTTPWLDDGDVQLFHGSAIDVLRALPASSVQTCITSPPYWGLRSYLDDGHADKSSELGLERTPAEYVAALVAVFAEVWRVLRADGTLWLNLGDSYAGGGGFAPDAPSNQNGSKQATSLGSKPGGIPVIAGLKAKDLVGIPWMVARALQEPRYTGTITRVEDRIWLAAMIDAEGCLFIHKRKVGQSNGQGYERKNDSYGAGLEVSSTDRVIVERCMEIAGIGSICEQTPQQNDRRKQTLYRWNARSNACRDVIREVYPHLVAKQHEARLLLGCPSSGPDAERAHESLKAIHQGGTPGIDFAAPESMFVGGWYLRSDIIWSKKPNPMPESVTDRPTKAHEYVFLLAKQPRYYYDAGAIREAPAPSTGPRLLNKGTHAKVDASRNDAAPDMAKSPHEAGRNARSVWEIATQPTPEAHFATFPEALVRRCILAGSSEAGGCAKCGAPWQRQTERAPSDWAERKANGEPMRHGLAGAAANGAGGFEGISAQTTGWTPSCECGAPQVPQTVLDPFVGSGTTCLVARKLGRRATGIDLSADYLAIAARRLGQQSLFAQEMGA